MPNQKRKIKNLSRESESVQQNHIGMAQEKEQGCDKTKQKNNQGSLISAALFFSLFLTSGKINIVTGQIYTVFFFKLLFNGILPAKIQILFFFLEGNSKLAY